MKLESLVLWDETKLYAGCGNVSGYKGTAEGYFLSEMPFFTADFSAEDMEELDEIIDFLCGADASKMLYGNKMLEIYCNAHMQAHVPFEFNCECWAFRIVTEKNVWYLFCTPWNDRRPFYFQLFDKEALFTSFAKKAGLPYSCYGVYPFTGERIQVIYSETEIDRFPQYGINAEENEKWAKSQNKKVNIMQRRAMVNGAIYGWKTPMANPQSYDADGYFREFVEQKNNKGERNGKRKCNERNI